MPALLPPDCWAAWLGETAAVEDELKAMLKPYSGSAMAFWPVDRRVGNVRNDSPDLFAPSREFRSLGGVIGGTSDGRIQPPN
jgi:putative SOS response-associated peptidase YedK